MYVLVVICNTHLTYGFFIYFWFQSFLKLQCTVCTNIFTKNTNIWIYLIVYIRIFCEAILTDYTYWKRARSSRIKYFNFAPACNYYFSCLSYFFSKVQCVWNIWLLYFHKHYITTIFCTYWLNAYTIEEIIIIFCDIQNVKYNTPMY